MIDRKALFAAVTGKGKPAPSSSTPVEGPGDDEAAEASAGARAIAAVNANDPGAFEAAILDIAKQG